MQQRQASGLTADRLAAQYGIKAATFRKRPHNAFGGLPAYPFHQTARTAEHIRFVLTPLSKDAIHKLAIDLLWHPEYLVLLCVEAEGFIGFTELRSLVEGLNPELWQSGLHAFYGHPDDDYTINGVEVRRAPHPYIAVVHKVAVEMTRDKLGETNYYQGCSGELRRSGDVCDS